MSQVVWIQIPLEFQTVCRSEVFIAIWKPNKSGIWILTLCNIEVIKGVFLWPLFSYLHYNLQSLKIIFVHRTQLLEYWSHDTNYMFWNYIDDKYIDSYWIDKIKTIKRALFLPVLSFLLSNRIVFIVLDAIYGILIIDPQ